MSPQVVKADEFMYDFGDAVSDIANFEETANAERKSAEKALNRNFKIISDNYKNISKNLCEKKENDVKKIYVFCEAAKLKLELDDFLNKAQTNFFANDQVDIELSRLLSYVSYYWQSVNYLKSLTVDERVIVLEKPGKILDTLCNAIELEGIFFKSFCHVANQKCLISLANELKNFLIYAVGIFMLKMFFVTEQYAFLADHCARKSKNAAKYHAYLQSAKLTFKQMKCQLIEKGNFIDILRNSSIFDDNILLHWQTKMQEIIFPKLTEDTETGVQELGLTRLHVAAFQAVPEVIKAELSNGCCQLYTTDAAGFTPLHCAVFGGVAVLELLLSYEGNNINAQSQAGLTALHLAVINNTLAVVQVLLQHPKIDVNMASLDGWTALHIAVSMQHVEIVAELLKVLALDVNAKIYNEISALHIAAKLDAENLLKILLERGAKINETTANGLTAQQIAEKFNCFKALKVFTAKTPLQTKSSNQETVNASTEITTNVAANNTNTVVPAVNVKENIAENVVEDLEANAADEEVKLSAVATFLQQLSNEENDTTNQLFQAVLKGELNSIKYLVDYGADLTKTHKSGKNAVDFAILADNLEIFEYLLEEHKLKLDQLEMLVFQAAESGAFDIVRYLLEKKALNPQLKNKSQKSLLIVAIESGSLKIIDYLIEDHSVSFKSTIENCALCTAVQTENFELVKYFLNKGLSTECSCEQQRPILTAARNSNSKIWFYLIELGAALDVRSNGKDVFDYAAIAGNTEILNFLATAKNYKLDTMITGSGLSAFFQVARAGQLKDIKYFVETKKFDVHAKGPLGGTILHEAAFNRHLDVVRYFVEEHGLDVKARDNKSFLPSFYAAQQNNLAVVKYFMLNKKLGLHLKDQHNRTILHIAAMNGALDVVRYLVEAEKANLNVKDNDNLTPLLISAKHSCVIDVINYFFKQQYDIDVEPTAKASTLHLAAKSGDVELVKILVETKGMSEYERDAAGQTPIFYAALAGKTDVVKYFMEITTFKCEYFHKKDNKGQCVYEAVCSKFRESDSNGVITYLKTWKQHFDHISVLISRFLKFDRS